MTLAELLRYAPATDMVPNADGVYEVPQGNVTTVPTVAPPTPQMRRQIQARAMAGLDPTPEQAAALDAAMPRLERNADKSLSFLAGAADPFGIPSAVTGLVSPEARDAWRGRQAVDPELATVAGALTSIPTGLAGLAAVPSTMGRFLMGGWMGGGSDVIDAASGKEGAINQGTAAKTALGAAGSLPVATLAKLSGGAAGTGAAAVGLGALFPERVAADDGSPKEKGALDTIISSFRGKDFTPPSKEEFAAAFNKRNPRPRQPTSLEDYVAAESEKARQAVLAKKPGWIRGAENSAKSAAAQAKSTYATVSQKYDEAVKKWNANLNAEYEDVVGKARDAQAAHNDLPFAQRNPAASAIGGFVAPIAAAALTHGRMQANRTKEIARLSDDVASGALPPTQQAISEEQLKALLNSVPKDIVGQTKERITSAVPAIALGSLAKVGEDTYDFRSMPEGSGAKANVVHQYTTPEGIAKTAIGYGMRAAAPIGATTVTGLLKSSRPNPAQMSRAEALVNAEGREKAAAQIAQRNGAFRDIDQADEAARRQSLFAGELDSGADQQRRVALADLLKAGPTPGVRQDVEALLAQRARGQLPPPERLKPLSVDEANPAIEPPKGTTNAADNTASPVNNQSRPFELTPPPDGGPPVKAAPTPGKLPDQADPNQLSLPLSLPPVLRQLPPQYRPLVEQELMKNLNDPARREILNSVWFADDLAKLFADRKLPPIPENELLARVENLFDRTRTTNRTLMAIDPRKDGTPRRTIGQESVQKAMSPQLWDEKTFVVPGAIGAGVAGAAALPPDAQAEVRRSVANSYMAGTDLTRIKAADVQGNNDPKAVEAYLGTLRDKMSKLPTRADQLRALKAPDVFDDPTSPTGKRDASGRFVGGGQ